MCKKVKRLWEEIDGLISNFCMAPGTIQSVYGNGMTFKNEGSFT